MLEDYNKSLNHFVYFYPGNDNFNQLVIIDGNAGINSIIKDTIIEGLELVGYVNIFPTQLFMVETINGPRLSSHLPIYKLRDNSIILLLNATITQYRVEEFVDKLISVFEGYRIHFIADTQRSYADFDGLVCAYTEQFIQLHPDQSINIKYGHIFAGIGSELLLAINNRNGIASMTTLYAKGKYNHEIAMAVHTESELNKYGMQLLNEVERLLSILGTFRFTDNVRDFFTKNTIKMVQEVNKTIRDAYDNSDEINDFLD